MSHFKIVGGVVAGLTVQVSRGRESAEGSRVVGTAFEVRTIQFAGMAFGLSTVW